MPSETPPKSAKNADGQSFRLVVNINKFYPPLYSDWSSSQAFIQMLGNEITESASFVAIQVKHGDGPPILGEQIKGNANA